MSTESKENATSSRGGRIEVRVVAGMDDFVKAMMVRSAVYIGEQQWTFEEDWDGNDFTATHLLATVDGEPAGTLRIRYFGEFAKPERLAVLSHFRQRRYGARGVAHALGTFAFDFCRQKGFTKFYGHALKHLVPFWAKFGGGFFQPMGDEIDCDGKICVPMWGELPPHEKAVGLHAGHMAIVRPEGLWDEPGYWEKPRGFRPGQATPPARPAAAPLPLPANDARAATPALADLEQAANPPPV